MRENGARCAPYLNIHINHIHRGLWIILIIILIGCGYQNSIPTQTAVPPGQWLVNLLSNPVCIPPCWEGIRPGKTQIGEAIETLNSIQDVTELQGPYKYPNSENVGIQWEFADDHGSGLLISNDQTKIVTQITLGPQSLSINKFMEKFGEPDQVFIFDTETNALKIVYIFYSNQNIMLETGGRVNDNGFRINPELRISYIRFVEDGWMEQYL